MRFRLLRLRFRRQLHLSEERAHDLSVQTEAGIERYLFKRIGRIFKIKRFVAGWTILMLLAIFATIGQTYLLSGYYQSLQPVPGGIYNEGILGTFTTANPIYAVSDVDMSVSHLIFASLFTYNSSDQLVGELASGYSVNAQGTVYSVTLKPNLTWQDGQPLTSSDVVFTYDLIENPNAQSPLLNSWQGIKVQSAGPRTVIFTLPGPLASFPEAMTSGILPEHILKNVDPSNMRSASFNTQQPIGSGPFSWQAIAVSGNSPTNAEEQIVLSPFKNFVLGRPRLDEFVVDAYADQTQLVQAFTSGQLTGLEGLSEVPKAISAIKNAQIHNFILTAGVYVFFKTSVAPFNSQPVRSALIQAVDVPAIISSLGYPTHEVNEPLLENQLGYNPIYQQPAYNLTAAENTLNQAGWTLGSGGIRTNNRQTLSFTLTVPNSPEYLNVANQLLSYWQKLGVSTSIVSMDQSSFSNALSNHAYQAVLYGISIGTDPDVYVYWDSAESLANSPERLNLSEWDNALANKALQAGRTTLDPAARISDYQGLLSSYQQDLPALGLYQPRLLYITNGSVFGLDGNSLNSSSDRLDSVWSWEIEEAKVTS